MSLSNLLANQFQISNSPNEPNLKAVLEVLHQNKFKEAKAECLTELYKEIIKFYPQLKKQKWDPSAEATKQFWSNLMDGDVIDDTSLFYTAKSFNLAKNPANIVCDKNRKEVIDAARMKSKINKSQSSKNSASLPPKPVGNAAKSSSFGSANALQILTTPASNPSKRNKMNSTPNKSKPLPRKKKK